MGFPFDLYKAKPAVVRGHADTLVKKSTDIHGVNAKALKQKAHAAEQIDGELKNLLDEPFENIGKDSKQLSLASAFAAGVLYRWASAITTFNKGVRQLNQEYATKKANDFGVPDAPAGPSGGYSPGELQERHDNKVASEKSALLAELKDRWKKLDNALDKEAVAINAQLQDGPDKQSVLALFAAGHLPQRALPLLTSVGLDPKRIKEVLSHIKTLLRVGNGPGPSLAWSDLLDSIKGMDPRAATVILGLLSKDELKELGARVSSERNNSDFYSFILAGASKDQVNQLKNLWREYVNPSDRGTWQDPASWHSLFNSGSGATNIGANQGPVDDCWMLAKLNAIVGADPNWPQEHVRDNGNGTVSVKFYDDDGNPYWVTVTKQVALDKDGNYQTAYPDGDNAAMWAVYYEKAMAVDDHSPGGLIGSGGGGYEGLTAGFSHSADEYMTGKESDNVEFGDVNPFADPYSAVVEAQEHGKGVVAGNWNNEPLPWDGGDDDMQQMHVYYVKDIQSDGDVVLGNPWGHSDVVLTPDEFNDYMEDVSVVNQ